MKTHTLTALCGAAVVIASLITGQGAIAQSLDDPRLTMQVTSSSDPSAPKILFVGNSFIYQAGVGALVAEMIKQGTHRDPKVMQVVAGGFSLEKHWAGGVASKLIQQKGPWDYVVLQDQSEMAISNPQSLQDNAAKFADLARRNNAKTVLYETWSDRARPDLQQTITSVYRDAASNLHAAVVPVGEAFWKTRATYPNIDLYDRDSHHPSVAGGYLAACMFYSLFTGKSSQGLPSKLMLRNVLLSDLPPVQAQQLQTIADSVMMKGGLQSSPPSKKQK